MPELPEPLHPAVVHLPLALAIVLPILTLIVALAMWRGWFQRRTWILVVLLQCLLLGSTWYAQETGEAEEDVVEAVTGDEPLHAHEEAAETLFLVAVIATALALATLFLLGSPKAAGWGSLLTLLATLVTLWASVETGKLGGELVYEHGAAGAYTQRAVEAPAGTAPMPDDDDDDSD
ncbi:MAG: DUF2231 domain-containing protein [Planctomycetota bacterium]|jgi:uncharacterized membrane protein